MSMMGAAAAFRRRSAVPVDPLIPIIRGYAFPDVSTSHNIPIPATLAGDVIVVMYGARRPAGVPWQVDFPSGWSFATRKPESGNLTFDCGVMYRVTPENESPHSIEVSLHTGFSLAVEVWVVRGSSGVVLGDGFRQVGGTTTLDPPELSTPWGTDDVLWIAGHGGNGTAGPDGWPDGFTRHQRTTESGGDFPSRIIACATVTPGPSMDPTPFVMGSNASPWVFTAGVRLP